MIELQQLQALVDGECTASERRALLAKIDTEPKYWRMLALSLLEEQVFQKQVKRMAEEPTPRVAVAVPMHAAAVEKVALTGRQEKSFNWFPVLAACLIVSIGFAAGRFWNSSSTDRSFATSGELASYAPTGNVSSSSIPSSLVTHKGEDGLPYADLRVSTPNGDIPIYDPNEVDPALLLYKQRNELSDKLRRSGYEMDMQQDFATGKLQDGRTFVVPIQKVGLRSWGQ
jgi:hypothetical protein